MIYNLVNEKILNNLIGELKTLPFNTYEVVIRPKKRSLDQNALYWKWLEIISNDTGYTKDELHDSFRQHFLGSEFKQSIFGDVYPELKSTTKLKKKEFTEYLNKVQVYAAQQGITLPTKQHYGW